MLGWTCWFNFQPTARNPTIKMTNKEITIFIRSGSTDTSTNVPIGVPRKMANEIGMTIGNSL